MHDIRSGRRPSCSGPSSRFTSFRALPLADTKRGHSPKAREVMGTWCQNLTQGALRGSQESISVDVVLAPQNFHRLITSMGENVFQSPMGPLMVIKDVVSAALGAPSSPSSFLSFSVC
jgi:hypothetical protein